MEKALRLEDYSELCGIKKHRILDPISDSDSDVSKDVKMRYFSNKEYQKRIVY